MTSFNHQFTVEGEEEEQKGKDEESKRTMEGERDGAKEKEDQKTLKEEESEGGLVIYQLTLTGIRISWKAFKNKLMGPTPRVFNGVCGVQGGGHVN